MLEVGRKGRNLSSHHGKTGGLEWGQDGAFLSFQYSVQVQGCTAQQKNK